MAQYLDKAGLTYLWSKIKAKLAAKANIPLVVNMGTISSLPVTKTVNGVTADMVVSGFEIGNPSAFGNGVLTVTTAANKVTISGVMNEYTNSTIKLTLVNGTQVTGT